MKFLLPLVAFLLLTLPAEASTLPRVDFAQGDRIVSAGLLDVNFDYALLDQVSLGVSLIPLPFGANNWYDPILSPFSVAARATYRIGTWGGVAVGLTVSSGYAIPPAIPGSAKSPFPGLPILRYAYMNFLHPAINVAVPLGSAEGHWTLRATAGPLFGLNEAYQGGLPFWPNIEFSKPLGPNQELTLLGNSLIGWRGVF